jgi:hypothetical protein
MLPLRLLRDLMTASLMSSFMAMPNRVSFSLAVYSTYFSSGLGNIWK